MSYSISVSEIRNICGCYSQCDLTPLNNFLIYFLFDTVFSYSRITKEAKSLFSNRRIYSRLFITHHFFSSELLRIAAAISATSSGSTYRQSGPPASSRQLPVHATTGKPLCIASIIGIPKPSYREG